MSVVVSDTSPIRALHHLGLIGMLERLYGAVLVPDSVATELTIGNRRFPSLDLTAFPFIEVRKATDADAVARLRIMLDAGEAEAIVLAEEIHASLLLIDERIGAAYAAALGLRVTGVVGVLIQAKRQTLVKEVGPVLHRLRDEAGFFLSENVLRQAKILAGEP